MILKKDKKKKDRKKDKKKFVTDKLKISSTMKIISKWNEALMKIMMKHNN